METDKKDRASIFIEKLTLRAGIAIIRSRAIKESNVILNFDLSLRPSVLKVIAETFESVMPSFDEKEKQKQLTTAVTLFLSDSIDQGIIGQCIKLAGRMQHDKRG